MAPTIEYRITGAGWAECVVSVGSEKCELTASYLSDALGNLVLAAVAVVSGFSAVSFGFDEEPGEYRWSIRTTGPTEVTVTVLSFDELWSNKGDEHGKTLLRFTCHPLEFGRAVLAAAEEVLRSHGVSGYKKAWIDRHFRQSHLKC